jgi:signal transduction histidine kinase
LLFGLLICSVLIFTLLALWSVEAEAQEVVDKARGRATAWVEQALGSVRQGVERRVQQLVALAGSRQFDKIERERGTWMVFALDRDLRLSFPVLSPCPPLDSPVPERELTGLLRAWLRSRDPAAFKRAAGRVFWTSGSPRLQASALARLAAACVATGAIREARYYWDLIGDRYPGARDVTGLALGPAAALARARLLADQGQAAAAHGAGVQLLSDLARVRDALAADEDAHFQAEARALLSRTELDPAVSAAAREAAARLADSPYPRVRDRLRAAGAGGATRRPGGAASRLETPGGRQYIQFDRRVEDMSVVVLAPAEEIEQNLPAALGEPAREGYRVFEGREIPAPHADTFAVVARFMVPYLESELTLGADRAQLVTLQKTRRTFLGAMVSLALLLFFLAGFLIARDVRRHLELARLKAEFIGNVSHELKTPLTAIRVFAETLLHGRCRKDREKEYLKKILTESDHLTSLIENVLQLSRAEDLVIDQRRTVCGVKQIAEAALEQMKVRWEDRQIEVEAPDDVRLSCDANLVTLAVANLLDNAAKYSDARAPIRLTGGATGDHAWFSVADRGRGIPAADQGQIFQRFYRARNVADHKGMGLGLFLVQKIADLHRGTVQFDSQEGVGSTFTLRIPGVVAAAAAVATAATAATAAKAAKEGR